MIRRIILSPDVETDIKAVALWYRHKEPSVGFRFSAELRLTLRLIAQFPYAFPVISADIRRALMKAFPYSLYFALKDDTVAVIALFHQHRRPRFGSTRDD